MKFRFALAFVAALALQAHAHEYQAGDVHVEHPTARPSLPGQKNGAAYLTLENKGTQADRLLSASSTVAQSVQIHSMKMEGDVMKMREADGISLAPAAKVAMQPGDGYHIMLLGLKKPLKIGDKFPLTLIFEKAGKLDVSVWVEGKAASATHAHH
ncbi:MAG: copper chaperone PCu(A)C [Proteobacteria bacterium]|nr:copper chaperone PCu(A)C [Pseudomonadota bacterium]